MGQYTTIPWILWDTCIYIYLYVYIYIYVYISRSLIYPLENDGWKITFLLGWLIFRANFQGVISIYLFRLFPPTQKNLWPLFQQVKVVKNYTPGKLTAASPDLIEQENHFQTSKL